MKTSKRLAIVCTLVFLSGCNQAKSIEVKKDSKLSDIAESIKQDSLDDGKSE